MNIDDAIRYQNHLLASGIDIVDKADSGFDIALNRIESNGNILFGEGFAKNEKSIKKFIFNIKECLTLKSKSKSYEQKKFKILDQ